MARMLGHQLHAIRHRILLDSISNFINQRLHHKRGVCGAYRAPPKRGHIDLRMVHHHVDRNVVGIFHAFVRRAVHAVFHEEGLKRRAFQDALRDDHMLPAGDIALCIKTDLGTVRGERAIVAGLHIVFAAPHHFHGRALACSR